MQLHDILLLRTLCNPAGGYISWGLTPTDTSLFLTTHRGGSHLPADIFPAAKYVMQLHDILLLRTSAILPEAISAGDH